MPKPLKYGRRRLVYLSEETDNKLVERSKIHDVTPSQLARTIITNIVNPNNQQEDKKDEN